MDASKLTIDPTLASYKKLSLKKRRQLQYEKVAEYIESRPYMANIKHAEFAKVLHLSNTGAFYLIKGLIKRGKIAQHELSLRSYAYTVGSPVKITKPATASTPPPAASPSHFSLATYAKEFAWDRNSDSLREFVQWMDNKELSLRRYKEGE